MIGQGNDSTCAVLVCAVICVALCGCSPRQGREPPQEDPTPVAGAVNVSPAQTAGAELTADGLFPQDRVLDVQIALAPKDWDEIRFQTRDFGSALNAKRKYQALQSPYSYVVADVSIDGVLFAQVGLRKKGFLGSQNIFRPSLKVKLNQYEKGRHIDGLKMLTFNNNQQDVTLMSQFMGYAFFNRVGVPAPRCGYAKVSVNGTYLGIYTHVESVRKPLVRREFGDAQGTLYEGTVVDFFAGWSKSFEREFGDAELGQGKIKSLIAALDGERGEVIIGATNTARAWIPQDGGLGDQWTDIEFDDSQWKQGGNGAGYETGQGYQELIDPAFDFKSELFNRAQSLYLRFPFEMAETPALAASHRLLLRLKYDDGYVAYLNGSRVASSNAPAEPLWNSKATTGHADSQALRYEDRDISQYRDRLRAGSNVLALQVLNVNSTSTDMLMVAELQQNAFDYEAAISEVVDLDAFFRFWAVEGLLGFWDGYSGNRNNYFVYLDAGSGKFHFIPWGADSLFEKYSMIDRTPNMPLAVKTQGRIAYRLYQSESVRHRYSRTLRDILDRHWDEETLLAEVDRIEALLVPVLPDLGETGPADGGNPERGRRQGMQRFDPDRIREFIRTRRQDLLDEITPEMPVWVRAPGLPPIIGPDVPPDDEGAAATEDAAAGDRAAGEESQK